MITLLFPSLSAIREVDRRLIHSGAKKLNWQFLTAKVAPFTSQPFFSLPTFLLSAFFLYSLPPIVFVLLPTSSLYSSPLLTSFSFPHFSSSFPLSSASFLSPLPSILLILLYSLPSDYFLLPVEPQSKESEADFNNYYLLTETL